MIKYFFILIFIAHHTISFSQTGAEKDSVTIILKNISNKEFTEYKVSIKGQFIGGDKLKSGQSIKVKIPLTGQDLYRFTIYIDEKLQDKYSIEPADYFELVSKMKLEKNGIYRYLINIDYVGDEGGSLYVKLERTN